MPDHYSPKDDLDYSLRYWWLVVLLMAAGVAAGWIFNKLIPPVYESGAEISVSIDITRTGTLTGENQDMLIDAVGDIIGSPQVMEALAAEIQNPEDLKTYLERKADRFALRVTGRNPQQIMGTAERWSELAIAELDKASQHVIRAEILERSIDGLSNCVKLLPSGGDPAGSCDQLSFDEVQKTIDKAGAELQTEKAASLGLIPGIRYWLSQTPQVPTQPVQYNRKQLLLAGAVIGLVLGLWLLHMRLPDRLVRRNRGD